MDNYIQAVEKFWQIKDLLNEKNSLYEDAKRIIGELMKQLNYGKIVVCQKNSSGWQINSWVKKAILLHFKITKAKLYEVNCMKWYDKISPRFKDFSKEDFDNEKIRIVPGAVIREGSYIGKNAVIMPSFINTGAYVGDGTMVDTWATIGSCAYVGSNCHISGGTGIGGVLEPIQAKPVIIEDNCFIGARSEIAEGVLVEEGSVISMGVFIGASTKIVNRTSGKIIYGKVPAFSVVVPGVLPGPREDLPGLYCAVIIKQVDKKTRDKTSINKLLRA